jgi:hypothetical protein
MSLIPSLYQLKETHVRSFVRIGSRTSLLALFAMFAVLATFVSPANAQLSDLYPGFFQLERPGYLQATFFGGGFVSQDYGATDEGIQLGQSITQYIGLFGRATAYQLFLNHGQTSPLNPSNNTTSGVNFGRFQGGLDFTIYPGTDLFVSGGGSAGDAGGSLVEGDFSSWLWPHSPHPLNFSFSSLHTFQNGVTSSAIDFQWALKSTENWLLMGGAGGAIFGGGIISDGLDGQGGPDLGAYYRPWKAGFSLQAGYGTSKTYGQFTVYKQLEWTD